MAKQDFAQVKASTKAKSESGSGSILSAIGVLVIAGLCFSGGYWLGSGDIRQTGNKTDSDASAAKLAAKIAENRVLQAKNEALQDMVEQWKKKAKQGAHTKVGELSFYKDLPKQSVTPAPVPDLPKAAPKVKPAHASKAVETQQVAAVGTMLEPAAASMPDVAPTSSASTHTPYHIQLASFRTEADAMTMQQKLMRSGFHTQVKRADLGEKGLWFRLYAGPYDSRAHAETAQQKIETQTKLKGFLQRVK